MIVNDTERGWQVILQPAHAMLAGQIALQFRADLRPAFWCETIAAIIQHDDYKSDFRGRRHLRSTGSPKDFAEVTITAPERFEESLQRLQSHYAKHRWIGLLQSLHIERLHAGQPVAAKLKRLIQAERCHRRAVLRDLQVDAWELDYAYELLHWCDRCSLILAQDELPEMNRRLEVITALTDETYFIRRRVDGSVAIEPWPFEAESVEVQLEYRTLTKLTFDDDLQLKQALDTADVKVAKWQLRWAD